MYFFMYDNMPMLFFVKPSSGPLIVDVKMLYVKNIFKWNCEKIRSVLLSLIEFDFKI